MAKNQATKWFEDHTRKNSHGIAIHKAVLRLACQIKEEREKRNLSQRDLAQKAGVTQTTIVRLEHGKNASIETLFRVAEAIGVTVKELF